MKRAWPYALALAVVVTGCYLALAPLLRSLSPAPTSSATSQLSSNSDTITVGKQATVSKVQFNGGVKGTNIFVANTRAHKNAKKKAKKSTPGATSVAPTTKTTQSDSNSGFAANPPSSSSTSSNSTSSGSTTSTTPKAPAKTVQKKGAATVGGTVVQSSTGDSGLAGGNDSGTSDLGQKPDVGG